jgi:nitroreductase
MNIVDALKSRRTVRQYDPTYTIPSDVLNELIDLALTSPTGMNAQEVDLVVLTDRAKIDSATGVTFNSFPPEQKAHWNKRKVEYGVTNVVSCDASAIFLFVKNERAEGHPFPDFDAGGMTTAIMAAARKFGLHTMCLGALQFGDRAGFEREVGIAPGAFIYGLAVGKPINGPLKLLDKGRKCKATFIE